MAYSLNTLSERLAEHGRHREALDAVREAVSIRRELAAVRPDAVLPDLASSLNTLSERLSEQGRHDEAFAGVTDAVATFGQLSLSPSAASAKQINITVKNYLANCKRADKNPDAALLSPILGMLQRANLSIEPTTKEENR